LSPQCNYLDQSDVEHPLKELMLDGLMATIMKRAHIGRNDATTSNVVLALACDKAWAGQALIRIPEGKTRQKCDEVMLLAPSRNRASTSTLASNLQSTHRNLWIS
jgi:hypothetical protein